MHSYMSASRVCSASKGTDVFNPYQNCLFGLPSNCAALAEKASDISKMQAASAVVACILLMSEAFSANAACSKGGMSGLHKLYCS